MCLNDAPLAGRVMLSLLYDCPLDVQWEGFDAHIRISTMARKVGSKNSRVKEALKLLKERGLLDSLELGHGFAKMRIATPKPLSRLLN